MSKKVLDYHDILLREADVKLLDGPHWLNDQVSDLKDVLHIGNIKNIDMAYLVALMISLHQPLQIIKGKIGFAIL